MRKAAAWSVHFYTGCGGLIGMLALLTAAAGDIRATFGLLVITMIIDGTDGILARRVRVRDVLPKFDGASLDNVIDVLTYGYIPIYIMATQNLLPHPAWALVPTAALLYAYGQVDMKTPDSFFLGFPSYWNVVALYLFWMRPEPAIAVALVVVPAILTFIPTRYLYPSKNQVLWQITWPLVTIWFALLLYLLGQETPNPTLVSLSLYFPIYYLVASFWVEYKKRMGTLPPEPREEHRIRRFEVLRRPFRFRLRRPDFRRKRRESSEISR
jgi:phosphatidylcholine synthase